MFRYCLLFVPCFTMQEAFTQKEKRQMTHNAYLIKLLQTDANLLEQDELILKDCFDLLFTEVETEEKMLELWEKGVMRLVTDHDENINEFLKEKYPDLTWENRRNVHHIHIFLNNQAFNYRYLDLHDVLEKTFEDNMRGFVKRFEAKLAEHKDKFGDNVLKIEGIRETKKTLDATIKKQLYPKNA